MVRSILEIFLWEHKLFRAGDLKDADAPVAISCAESAVANFEPIFRQENVTLLLTNNLASRQQKVVAEEDQLERVLSNLLENALRFSPPGSTVRVLLEDASGPSSWKSSSALSSSSSSSEVSPDQVMITVSDQGPGVAKALATSLFERFAGGTEFGGRGGFGLYYCQMCLKRWGGKIIYIAPEHQQHSVLEQSGACFRLALLKFS